MNFAQHYDSTIRDLESKLSDLIDGGAAFDLERKGDVLNIEFEDGEKIVITPQSPLEQLWVSADYGGHRFIWSENEWVHEKDARTLLTFLQDALSNHLSTPVTL